MPPLDAPGAAGYESGRESLPRHRSDRLSRPASRQDPPRSRRRGRRPRPDSGQRGASGRRAPSTRGRARSRQRGGRPRRNRRRVPRCGQGLPQARRCRGAPHAPRPRNEERRRGVHRQGRASRRPRLHQWNRRGERRSGSRRDRGRRDPHRAPQSLAVLPLEALRREGRAREERRAARERQRRPRSRVREPDAPARPRRRQRIVDGGRAPLPRAKNSFTVMLHAPRR